MTTDSNATPAPNIKAAFVLAAPLIWRAQHDGIHELAAHRAREATQP